jgi:hypothetical protein
MVFRDHYRPSVATHPAVENEPWCERQRDAVDRNAIERTEVTFPCWRLIHNNNSGSFFAPTAASSIGFRLTREFFSVSRCGQRFPSLIPNPRKQSLERLSKERLLAWAV